MKTKYLMVQLPVVMRRGHIGQQKDRILTLLLAIVLNMQNDARDDGHIMF
jgi:hypothetical protein